MVSDDEMFDVALSVSIMSRTGSAGSLHLNAVNRQLHLPAEKMAMLIVEAKKLMEDLTNRYASEQSKS